MKAAKSSSNAGNSKGGILPGDRISRLLLGIICFFAGAAVMVIEISANRLLAPNFGNSLYTWTALIGVILIAFSVGGYLGGALADKMKRMDLLGWLLAGAAGLTMLIPAINQAFSPELSKGGLISGPVIISLLLFALPGILLGAVSPASVRFYSLAGHDEHVGRAAGTISMLGSLGSFVGTFLSGFVLLSSFGIRTVFISTGVVLLLLAVVAFLLARKSLRVQSGMAAAVAACALVNLADGSSAEPHVIFQQNSFYHQITITESPDKSSRFLKLDSTMEGGMTWPAGELVLNYQDFWQLAKLNDDLKIKHALFIGAGAFGMPEQVARLGADVQVDVAEIDPAVIEIGRSHFKLNEFGNIHAEPVDARRFLAHAESAQYDLIFGDAYNGIRHVPAHLVTREFFVLVKSRLSPDGVFLMNVISSVEGDRSALLAHILPTLRAVFPNVEVFTEGARHESQNIILLGSMKTWKPWLEDRFYAADSWQSRLTAARVSLAALPAPREILTDDWNPIDSVIARQLSR